MGKLLIGYYLSRLDSILHYRGTDWARDQTIPTITSKIKGKEFVGPINGLLSQVLINLIKIQSLEKITFYLNL